MGKPSFRYCRQGQKGGGEAEIFLRAKAVESENYGTLPRRVSDD